MISNYYGTPKEIFSSVLKEHKYPCRSCWWKTLKWLFNNQTLFRLVVACLERKRVDIYNETGFVYKNCYLNILLAKQDNPISLLR